MQAHGALDALWYNPSLILEILEQIILNGYWYDKPNKL